MAYKVNIRKSIDNLVGRLPKQFFATKTFQNYHISDNSRIKKKTKLTQIYRRTIGQNLWLFPKLPRTIIMDDKKYFYSAMQSFLEMLVSMRIILKTLLVMYLIKKKQNLLTFWSDIGDIQALCRRCKRPESEC